MLKILLIILSFGLVACSSPDNSDSSQLDDDMASITVTIPGLSNRAKQSKSAQRVGVPNEVTSLLIEVLDGSNNVLDAAEVVGTDGTVTLTIAAGNNYTIRGSAYAGSELLFLGESIIAELKIGTKSSVSLQLDEQVTLDLTALADMEVGVGQSAVNFNLVGLNNLQINWYVNDVLGGNNTLGLITSQGLYTPPNILPQNVNIEIKAEPIIAPSFVQSISFQLLPSTAPNNPPTANAGIDQTVNAGDVVNLSSLSTDIDGSIVSSAWLLVSEDLFVTLSNANTANASFIAPFAQFGGVAIFELIVTDDDGATDIDTIIINVNGTDQPLVSNAGLDQVVNDNTLVTLNGSASNDPDNVITTYLWEELSSGSIVLNDNSAQQPTFTAPNVNASTIYTFRLTVTNDNGDQAVDTVDITVNDVVVLNNKVYFGSRTDFGNINLWVSDGTDAGTQEVAAVKIANYELNEFKTIGDYFYFQGDDSVNGRELWRSNGTLLGTEFFASAPDSDYVGTPGGASIGASPGAFSVLGDKLLYRGIISSVDGSNQISRYLAFDSLNQTVTTLSTSTVSSYYANNVGILNNETYFYDSSAPTFETILYKTDATNTATAVKTFNTIFAEMTDFTELNGELYFVFDRRELWKTDGTNAGTVQLRAFSGLIGTNNANFPGDNGVIAFNNMLYFVADDGINGRELWVSDGTPSGTQLLLDLDGTAASSNPVEFHIMNGRLLFFSSEAGASTDGIWVSDGTALGTTRISTTLVNSDIAYYNGNSTGRAAYVASLGLLFFTGNDGVNGNELWKTDGTALGTSMVKNISSTNSQPIIFRPSNGVMIFGAEDDDGRAKLWRTDGTEAGTTLIKDIQPSGFDNSAFFQPAA